jgi:hypothetical protein
MGGLSKTMGEGPLGPPPVYGGSPQPGNPQNHYWQAASMALTAAVAPASE